MIRSITLHYRPEDLPRALLLFETGLGIKVPESAPGRYEASLPNGSRLGIQSAGTLAPTRVDLEFTVREDLDDVADRLTVKGFRIGRFGDFLTLEDPTENRVSIFRDPSAARATTCRCGEILAEAAASQTVTRHYRHRREGEVE